MDKSKPTLAIYGIQDRENYPHPLYVHDHNLAIMQNGQSILRRQTFRHWWASPGVFNSDFVLHGLAEYVNESLYGMWHGSQWWGC